MKYFRAILVILLLVPALSGVALAEDHDNDHWSRGSDRHDSDRHDSDRHDSDRHDSDRHDSDRHGWRGEISHFHEHDADLWRGGHWHHGTHLGQSGWWWIVGSTWYFYPSRIDPFPDPYQPPVVVVPPNDTPPQFWYYCANPAGYYPYVARCLVGWQRVRATPAQ